MVKSTTLDSFQAASPEDAYTATITNDQGESADLDSTEAQTIVEGVVRSALGMPGELPHMPAPATPPPAKSVLRVPSESEFGEDGEEYFISSALRARAMLLIDRHPDLFEHLDGMSLTYLWKKAGGKSKGAPVLGRCTKPSGLLKLFSESTFVIWLAADHCRASYYGDVEIEQTLFHEMLHTGEAEPDENTGRGGGPVLVPHQLEIFHAEIEVYGLDAVILRDAAPLFREAARFGQGAEAGYIENPPTVSAVMQAGADLVREFDEILDGDPNDPENYSDPMGNPPPDAAALPVCSVCNVPITGDDAPQYDLESPVVVLCEACGEDGILDDGEEELIGDGTPREPFMGRSVDIDPAHLGDGGR